MPIPPAPCAPLTPDPPFPTSTSGCWRLGRKLYSEFRPYERTLTDLLRARAQVAPLAQDVRNRIEALGGTGVKAGRELQRKNASLLLKASRIDSKFAEYGRLRDRLRALSIHMTVKGLVRGKDVPTFPLKM